MNIVASDGYVYWAETLTDTPKTSAVWRVRTSGEGAEQLATLHNDYGDEVAIGVSSKFVAVLTYNVGDQLFLVSKADHSIRSIGGHLDVNSLFVALDDANAYVGTETNALMAVPLDGSPPHATATGLSAAPYVGALDSQRVYASLMFGPIVAVDWAGNVTQLATGGFPLAVDADAIYVASQDQHIERIALVDGTTTALAPQSSLSGPWALAIDSSFVYWSDHAGISRVAKTGGSVESITSGGGAVTVDDSCVYWFSDGIWTAPK